jgi:hypothetical protein
MRYDGESGMKWKRRLLLAALFLGIFLGTLGIAGWWLAKGSPDWYVRHKLAPQEVEAAASRAEQHIQATLSWAQDRQAEALHNGQSHVDAAAQDPGALEIVFTEDELNGFFEKWDATFGWSERYRAYLTDPEVVLRDGRLILAATVNDLGAVLSVEFQPRLSEGKLYLPVTRVLAGRLPLPRAMWERYRGRAEECIRKSLPQWQGSAELTPRDGANADAVKAAMGELVLSALTDQPAAPILFVPYSMSGRPRSLPVKFTELKVSDQKLSLRVQPIDAQENRAFLSAIRQFKASEGSAAGTN